MLYLCKTIKIRYKQPVLEDKDLSTNSSVMVCLWGFFLVKSNSVNDRSPFLLCLSYIRHLTAASSAPPRVPPTQHGSPPVRPAAPDAVPRPGSVPALKPRSDVYNTEPNRRSRMHATFTKSGRSTQTYH